MFGPILAHVQFRGTIRERTVEPYLGILGAVRRRKKFAGLLFDISSGGGDGVASEDLYRAVKRVAAVKPVVATIGSMAASGGYMAVLGARKVYAHEDSDVGSIGVFIPHISVAGLLSRLGIEVELLHHGKHKDAYQGLRPLTDEERAKVLEVARYGYESFIQTVARERKAPVERVRTLATGEYWSGRQALGLGLVDALGDREDAQEELGRMTGVSPDRVVRVTPSVPFVERFVSRVVPGMAAGAALALRDSIEDGLFESFYIETRQR